MSRFPPEAWLRRQDVLGFPGVRNDHRGRSELKTHSRALPRDQHRRDHLQGTPHCTNITYHQFTHHTSHTSTHHTPSHITPHTPSHITPHTPSHITPHAPHLTHHHTSHTITLHAPLRASVIGTRRCTGDLCVLLIFMLIVATEICFCCTHRRYIFILCFFFTQTSLVFCTNVRGAERRSSRLRNCSILYLNMVGLHAPAAEQQLRGILSMYTSIITYMHISNSLRGTNPIMYSEFLRKMRLFRCWRKWNTLGP